MNDAELRSLGIFGTVRGTFDRHIVGARRIDLGPPRLVFVR